jgi:hypothetical protein
MTARHNESGMTTRTPTRTPIKFKKVIDRQNTKYKPFIVPAAIGSHEGTFDNLLPAKRGRDTNSQQGAALAAFLLF